jgi:fumarylacetoacetase
MKSWISYDASNNFPLENIPFGAFMNPTTKKVSCCTRVGDKVIDLAIIERERLFDGPIFSKMSSLIFGNETLNVFAGLGAETRKEARESLQKIFAAGNEGKVPAEAMFEAKDISMRMPVKIGDYTDFYSSKNHAYNVGCMFRGPANALNPNWVHLPVGYHGRASSIVVDGTPIRRPKGQVGPPPGQTEITNPSWSKCNRLDLELEMGTIIGQGN